MCGDLVKECALQEISPLGLFMLRSLLGHMNSSAGATERNLVVLWNCMLKVQLSPVVTLSLSKTRLLPKELRCSGRRLGTLAASLTFPKSMCGGAVGEVCLCGWAS